MLNFSKIRDRIIEPLNKTSRATFAITLSAIFILMSLAGYFVYQKYFPDPDKAQHLPKIGQNLNQPVDTAWIGASTPHLSLGYDGVIMISSLDEPAIQLSSYNTANEVDISFYKADENTLLQFLVHDDKNQQVSPAADVSKLKLITNIRHSLSTRSEGSKLALPIDETGMLLVRAMAKAKDTQESITKDFLVVRSNFGVLTKEAEQELIFWGQSFKDLKSIASGTVRVYNLENKATILATDQFDNSGVARTKLTKEADLALAFYGGAVAAIPINVRYLNSTWGGYQNFQDRQLQERHFVFTDRPFYRPGDTIYFKAILRNDNDAQYSVPRGQAEASLWSGWESRGEPLAKSVLSISAQGAVDGQFKLPDDASSGDNYRLVVKLTPTDTSEGATATFQVERFRKPEYGIEVKVNKDEFISGDKATFTVSGNYFSGQPLANKIVKYAVFSSDFYDYGYYSSRTQLLDDDYRYGYWRSNRTKEGEVALNSQGQAQIIIDTGGDKNALSDKVFSLEAVYEGEAGNPSLARKNIIVYRGEYGIFRDDDSNYDYSVSAGTNYQLPLILVSRKNNNPQGVQLTAEIKREQWVPYYSDDDSYPHYRQETETLSARKLKTDSSGKALLSFIPEKAGFYDIKITGKDAAGNEIAKEFYAWVRDEGSPFYSEDNDRVTLTLQTNKEAYKPGETANLFISSLIKNRDVFVSLERGHMHRFEIVHIDGSLASLPVLLQDSDMPNIFAKVSSFSGRGYDTVMEDIAVSADGQRLTVDIETDSKVYGPGETVTAIVKTTAANGFPIAAETAVWAVDKALFELVDESPRDIFNTFWSERGNTTQESHSLQGITIYGAEMGGCFAADTPILMEDKTTKPIVNVEVGDLILTKSDANSNKLVPAKVTGKQVHEVKGYLIINGQLRITPVHILNVNGQWTEASNIQVGDLLINQNSESVIVTSVEWQLGNFTVYNLEVENYHTFIAGGIWVHNDKGGGSARSVFKDTAYWNPQVRTDVSGLARIRFTLPDNLTTWVISSLGATADTKVGNTRSEVVVTKDVIVRPILPNVLRQGDNLVLSSLVQNFTNQDHNFKTQLVFNAGEAKLTRPGNRFIKSNATEQEYWSVNPKKPDEQAVLTFSAQATDNKDLSDTVIQKLPVKSLGFVDRRIETGVDTQNYKIQLKEKNNLDKTSITLSLAPSVLGTLPAAIKYLVDYPYGCVEQTTSRLVPSIIAQSEPELFAEALAGKDIRAIIDKGLQRISELQNGDGGWGWWHGNSDAFVSAYVAEYLKLAQDLGFKVNPDMLSRVKNFFEQNLYGETRKEQPSNYISTKYALSLLGSDRAGAISLSDMSLTPDLLAMAVMTNIKLGDKNPQTNGFNQLISQAKEQGTLVYWEGGLSDRFGSKDASTALALRALIAGNASHDLMAKAAQYLAVNRQQGYWSNTFGTAQAMRAVAAYSRFAQETITDYDYMITLDGNELSQGHVNNFRQKIVNINFSGNAIKPQGSELVITKKGEGKLYSTLMTEEFRTDLNNAAVSQGLTITRTYENETNPKQPFRVGDTVKVILTVTGFNDRYQHAVIEDELPAGLIPINESLKNEAYHDSNDWWYGREVTENGMVLSLDWVWDNNKTYEYRARVVAEGRFMAPPAKTEMMYDPSVFARSSFYEFRTSQFLNK